MKLAIKPQSFLEWIALRLNLIPAPLIDTQFAFTQARAIMAASEIGIFEAIGQEGKTLLDITTSCQTHLEATRHLLDCLTGIGYLRWTGNKYFVRSRYKKWLLEDSTSNFKGKLSFQISEWEWMSHLEKYLKTGIPIELHEVIGQEEWAKYQRGMRDLSVNAAKELASKFKLPGNKKKLLDIGGSHGLYSIELCKRNPNLTCTVLELPGAIEEAQTIAEQHGFSNRVAFREGNVLQDGLDDFYDVVMINNVVHHFTAEENKKLASKIANALNPGGVFAIGEFVRGNHPGLGGAVASMAGLYFSLTSRSGTWTVEEMHSWQESAGLKIKKPLSFISLPGWKLITAVK